MKYLKNHVFAIILITLIIGLGAYTVYTANIFYPEYTYAQEHSLTLKTVLAASIVIGNIYFLITIPIFHWLSANLHSVKNEPKKPDYIILLCKLSLFFVWVYISNHVYDTQQFDDYVERMIIVGIFAATYIAFDILYFGLLLFSLSTQSFIESFKRKKRTKKENIIINENSSIIDDNLTSVNNDDSEHVSTVS